MNTDIYTITYFNDKGQKIEQKIKGTQKQIITQARKILKTKDLEIKGNYIVKKGDNEQNYVPYFEFKIKPITIGVMEALYKK